VNIGKDDNAPQPKSSIRTIVKLESNKILIEANMEEMVDWIKCDPTQIFGQHTIEKIHPSGM